MPNAAATTLRRGYSQVVLVVIDRTFVGDVSARTVEHVTADITDRGYTVLLHVKVSDEQLCDVVRALQPFGVLLLAETSATTRAQLGAAGARHVLGVSYADDDESDTARFWEIEIGAAQVRHLAGLGHEHIAYALPSSDSPRLPVARGRLAGANAEADRRGLPPVVAVPLPLDRSAVARQLTSWRDQAAVTAVCAHDDRMGIAVLAASSDLGWSVPAELAVIGADNNPESQLTTPALSTAWFPEARYSDFAQRWLAAAVAGHAPETSQTTDRELPPIEITRRQST
ncbi:substrate-binding domain-containing protein [Frankia sp. Mgl5]|nr:substrate-binding domain-containing protein [Frankia sp. Mgl5]